ncbi:MAG: metallophosphoesterase [Gammaproteobacteria bacterium]|nr:metallophosphoesterase [Gammaproteobacteria bacterium]
MEDGADDFHFVIVSDRTGGARPGVFAGAMPKVNLLSPAFVVSVGDLIEGYTENQAQLNREWDEMASFVSELEAPFFYVPGNHDMNNAVMAEEWQRRFGPSYYHFLYKDVLFVVVNTELFGMVGQPDTPVPGPWKQADQMVFIKSVLAQHPDPRWTIVLVHQPLWSYPSVNEDWLEVEALLGERDYTVFAGHFHQYSRVTRNDRNFITLATTGGGSGLRGTAFGEFDHVAWVTMREDGPRIANVLLDGIHDEDVSNPELLSSLTEVANAIEMEALRSTDDLFNEASQKVTITNPTESTLTIAPSVARQTNFNIQGLMPLSVPAGESVELFWRLSTDEPVPYHSLTAASVEWIVTGTIGERPVQFPVLTPVLPLSKYAIGTIDGAEIDGNLSEWGPLTYNAARQGDVVSPEVEPNDVSFQFDVREGPEHLYIGINVIDDDVSAHADLIPRAQDAIGFFIDPRDPAERDANMGTGEAVLGGDMAAQISSIVSTGAHAKDKLLSFFDDTNANTQISFASTDTGYAAELAVPLSYIASKAPNGDDWQEARISVSVYDLDSDAHAADVLYWQPFRYGGAPLAGSQVFVRPN